MTLQTLQQADWAGLIQAHDPASTDPGGWLRYGVALLQVSGPGGGDQANAFLAMEMARGFGASPTEASQAIKASGLLSLAEACRAIGLDDPADGLGACAQEALDGLRGFSGVGRQPEPGLAAAELDLGPEVVLTAIASRLHTLKAVVGSLLAQTLKPAAVKIYLSEDPYLLDTGIDPGCEVVQDLAALDGVEIQWTPNLGPYRKFHPYVSDARAQAAGNLGPRAERLFVTVDDDTIYPPRFLEYLTRNYGKYHCRVAHRGRRMLVGDGAFRPYGQWPDGLREPRLGNLPTGQSGVLYRLSDFPEDLCLEASLVLAPTADDLWMHWLLAMQGEPAVILQPNAAARTNQLAFPTADDSKAYADASLWQKFNSGGGDQTAGGNDGQIQAIDAFFKAKGFDLANVLSQEFEREGDLY